jgi:hypothetical protein
MTYTTPIIVTMFIVMAIIGWLAGVEPWMIAAGAVIAIVMYFVERRKA